MPLNYGGGSNWTTNTSGTLLECLNNTEIAVHDAGKRVASLMYYEGDNTNKITIGRDMGWGAIGSVVINGNIMGLGNTKLNNITTCISSLNVSGTTRFNNAITCSSSVQPLQIK